MLLWSLGKFFPNFRILHNLLMGLRVSDFVSARHMFAFLSSHNTFLSWAQISKCQSWHFGLQTTLSIQIKRRILVSQLFPENDSLPFGMRDIILVKVICTSGPHWTVDIFIQRINPYSVDKIGTFLILIGQWASFIHSLNKQGQSGQIYVWKDI